MLLTLLRVILNLETNQDYSPITIHVQLHNICGLLLSAAFSLSGIPLTYTDFMDLT